ncbi:hypothetical protein SDC9_167787 [bioreactor metagenome]|uniref:Uncharacterized protein n=1 Tax=bioreactor metagenome TaxID=1076179 RepID=A0A645G0P1_9ZZZZ
MRAHADGHVKIAVRAAAVTRAAHVRQAKRLSVVDARGNLERLFDVFADASRTPAIRAGVVDELTGSPAGRAGAS